MRRQPGAARPVRPGSNCRGSWRGCSCGGRPSAYPACSRASAPVRPGNGRIAVQIDRHGQVGEGRVRIVDGEIGNAAGDVGSTGFRVEADSRREVLDRLRVLVLGLVDQAAIVEGACIAAVPSDHGIEVVQSGSEVALLTVDVAAADIGDVIIRLDVDRPGIVGDGLLVGPCGGIPKLGWRTSG
jgi:hypothetical protein